MSSHFVVVDCDLVSSLMDLCLLLLNYLNLDLLFFFFLNLISFLDLLRLLYRVFVVFVLCCIDRGFFFCFLVDLL